MFCCMSSITRSSKSRIFHRSVYAVIDGPKKVAVISRWKRTTWFSFHTLKHFLKGLDCILSLVQRRGSYFPMCLSNRFLWSYRSASCFAQVLLLAVFHVRALLPLCLVWFCASDGTRTHDLTVKSRELYQLSYGCSSFTWIVALNDLLFSFHDVV